MERVCVKRPAYCIKTLQLPRGCQQPRVVGRMQKWRLGWGCLCSRVVEPRKRVGYERCSLVLLREEAQQQAVQRTVTVALTLLLASYEWFPLSQSACAHKLCSQQCSCNMCLCCCVCAGVKPPSQWRVGVAVPRPWVVAGVVGVCRPLQVASQVTGCAPAAATTTLPGGTTARSAR
jgi:hypothetical protein